MRIKGFLKDVGGASRVTSRREKLFAEASETLNKKDPINEVAKEVHPGKITLEVKEIKDVSPTARMITFISKDVKLPPFQAGQYISLDLKIGDTITTRPYSICSAPYQARSKKPFVAITVRNGRADGFAANYLYENTKVGDIFTGSMAYGQFYYEPLRDAKNAVALAGGSGITPFYSMAQEIAHGKLDFNLTILYGSVSTKDIILKEELETLKSKKVKIVNVISGDEKYDGEKGFLTREVIKKYSSKDTTYFICGPLGMYQFVKGELDALNVPMRRIRMEVFGAPRDISKADGYPSKLIDKEFVITVLRGINETKVKGLARESIAVSLERAGIIVPTRCRSGSCGYCRSQLVKGKVFIPTVGDGRRHEDKEEGYIHICSTYPLSNITVRIPIL